MLLDLVQSMEMAPSDSGTADGSAISASTGARHHPAVSALGVQFRQEDRNCLPYHCAVATHTVIPVSILQCIKIFLGSSMTVSG